MVTNVNSDVSTNASAQPLTNAEIAERFVEVADLLEQRGANPFRVRAYRRAADTIRARNDSIAQLIQEHGAGVLTEWPGIGKSLAGAIEHLCRVREWPLLNLLQGKHQREAVLATVPGVGPKLAARIRGDFGIETLPELEAAAHDGRLATMPGIGRKRLQSIRESLAGRFQKGGHAHPVHGSESNNPAPALEELLSIDEEYRLKAAKGRLVQVAPLRFNPTHQLWLPILHTRRNDRSYTAMFSNSALAHELGTTHDWVVIHRSRPDAGPWTVVTGKRGSLKDRRIVRGREVECEEYYARDAVGGLFDA